MAFYPEERLCIIIDGANLYSTLKTLDFDIDYGKLLALFRGKGRLQRAYYYTAIIEDEDFSPIKPLVDWLDYNGYHVVTKPAKQYKDRDGRHKTKGNMDMEMAIFYWSCGKPIQTITMRLLRVLATLRLNFLLLD